MSQFRECGNKTTLSRYFHDPRLRVAGRLDYDSEGLLLLTDDGQLVQKIIHPRYTLKKTYWAHTNNRIAVRFEYEWRNDSNQWFRAYGNENWEFDENGLMKKRFASINDLPIKESNKRL